MKETKSTSKDYSQEYWYTEQNIMMVIDKYIQKKGLGYFVLQDTTAQTGEFFESFFNGSTPRQAAQLVKKDQDQYKNYTVNNDDYLLFLSGPLTFRGLGDGLANDIEIALNLVKKEKKNLCRVIFPYQIYEGHWGLGVMNVDKASQKIDIVVFDPVTPGTTVSDQVVNSIEKLGFKVTKVRADEAYKYEKQQIDGTSCGVITAENAKVFISGNTTRLSKSYPSGAVDLRQAHLEEVDKNLKFIEWLTTEEAKYKNPDQITRELSQIWEQFLTEGPDEQKQELFFKTKITTRRELSERQYDETLHMRLTEVEDRNVKYFKGFLTANKDNAIIKLLYDYLIDPTKDKDGDYKLKPNAFDQITQLLQQRNHQKTEIHKPMPKKQESAATFPHELTSEGLRYAQHGNMYQLALLTIAASRAARNNRPFHLISEAGEYGKFDDLVIDYGDSVTLLQAKHEAEGNKALKPSYTKSDFKNTRDDDASLAKYFDSWVRLQKSELTKKLDGSRKATTYIFFTNRGVENVNDLERTEVPNDDFADLNDKATGRFKRGPTRQEYIDAIKSSKEASELTSNVQLSYKNIDWNALGDEKQKACNYLSIDCNFQYDKKSYKGKRIELLEKIEINGHANLSPKTEALIQLAVNMREVWDLLLPGYKYNCAIITTRNKNPIATLATNNNLDNLINQFLDSFIIKVWQPNKDQLLEVLYKELREDVKIAAKEFYDSISQYMLQWFSDRHQCLLSWDEFGKISTRKKGDLERFYLLGRTKDFEEQASAKINKLTDFPIIEGLDDFLSTHNKQNIAIVQSSNGGELVAYNSIKKYIDKEKVQDAEWFFLHYSDSLVARTSEVIGGESTRFLVLDCRDIENYQEIAALVLQVKSNEAQRIRELKKRDNELAQLKLQDTQVGKQPKKLEIEYENLEQQQKKLILLIDTRLEDILSALSLQSSECKTFDKRKLSTIEVEKLCEGKLQQYTTYAGKQVSLNQALHQTTGLCRVMHQNLTALLEIVKTAQPTKELIPSELPYDVYVPNDVIEGKPYYSLISILNNPEIDKVNLAQADIEKVREIVNQALSNDPQETDKKQRWLQKIDAANASQKSITIKFIDEVSEDVFVEENLAKVELIPIGYKFLDEGKVDFYERKDIRQTGKISILSANAGFGKSSLCLNVRAKWLQDENDISLVIKVNLPRVDFTKLSDDFTSIFNKKSTDVEWTAWQIDALKHDIRAGKKILILADGFDEIKNQENVKKFDKWLESLPRSLSLLITTRSYAASKINPPSQFSLGRYVTLKEYDEDQRKTYVSKFLTKIFDEIIKKIPDEQREAIIKKALSKLQTGGQSSLVGIPLETYIFCEALRPKLICIARDKTANIESVIDEISSITVLTLYKNFIYAKLALFMQKHMQVDLATSLSQPHRVYSFSNAYLDMLAAYAFIQAFSLPEELKDKYLNQIHQSSNMIDELNDSGIAIVEKANDTISLRFLHETYQEYFAAIFILQNLVLRKDELFEDLVLSNMYNPKFRIVFLFASLITIQTDPILPGFTRKDHVNLKTYWQTLFNDFTDILGIAHTELLQFCTKEFTLEEKSTLAEVTRLVELAELVKVAQLENSQEGKKQENEDAELEDGLAEVPVILLANISSLTSTYTDEYIKTQISNKEQVYIFVKNYLEAGHDIKRLAQLFKEINKEGYWAIDGGFKAMALLGSEFNQEFVDYFIKRIEDDPSWRVGPAMGALSILNKTISNDKQKYLFQILAGLINNIIACNNISNISKQCSRLINQHFSAYWEYLRDLYNNGQYESLNKLFNSAYLSKAAIVIDRACSKIKIVGENTFEIQLTDPRQITICRLVAFALRDSDKFNITTFKDFASEIENITGSLDNSTSYIPTINHEGGVLCNVFESLATHDLITKEAVDLLNAETKKEYATNRVNYWSINGGIKAVGYTGKFFNNDLAEFLILRASMWQDNRSAANDALKNLYQTLSQLDGHPDNKPAIDAYNKCIENPQFSYLKFEKVGFKGECKNVEVQTESSWVGKIEGQRGDSLSRSK